MKTTLQSLLRYLAISFLLIFSASAQQNTLSTSPNGFIFVGGTVGIGPTPLTVTVTSSPNPNVPFSIAPGAPWLTVSSQTAGSTPATVQFALNPNDKSIPGPGVYQATAAISGPSAATTTLVFIFTVNSPTPLSNNPASLMFSYTAGGSLPAAQPLNINASVAIPYTAAVSAPWLVLGAGSVSGTTPGTITVGVDPSKLTPSNSYIGSVTITPTNGLPSLVVPVVFLYFPSPQLTVTPSNLTFNYQIGGASNIVQKTINLTSAAGGSAINFTASSSTNSGGQQWLSVAPTAGATPGAVNVTVNPAGLPAGPYTGQITIIAPGASTPTMSVPVNLNVSAVPLLDLSTNTLSFNYSVGGALPADQFITPNGTTPGMAYTVSVNTNGTGNWLNVTASGITPAPVDVNVNPVGLPSGTYPATITFNALNGGNNPQVVNLTLTVSTVPMVAASPAALTFNYELGFNTPGSQTISITSGSGSLSFSVTANQNNTSNNVNWLLVGTPSSTTTPGSVTVAVSPGGMAAGQYTGTITITTPGNASSVQVPVTLNVAPMGTPLALVNTSSLTFNAQVGSNAAPQVVNVSSTGEAITYTVTSAVTTPQGGAWLTNTSGGVASAVTPSTFIVGVNSATLGVGSYKGTITVDPKNGNPTVVIPVTLNITLGNINLDKTTLSFQQNAGGVAPQPQTINVTSSGAPLQFTTLVGGANWLQVNSNSTTTPATLSVLVNASAGSLQPGNYTGQISVVSAGAGNSPQTVAVNLMVNPAQTLTLSSATLNFGSQFGSPAPAAQTVALTASNGNLAFTAAASVTGPSGVNWLSVTPTSGTASSTATNLSISVNPQGLNPGTYTGTVAVTAANASNSPQNIVVTYTVTAIPTPVPTQVQNGAGFVPGPIAPGQFVTIRGTNMGPATGVALSANSAGFYPTTSNNVTVTFDNIPAVLFYISAAQLNVIVPYGIAGRATVQMIVTYQNTSSTPIVLNVVDANPGIFNNTPTDGYGGIENEDYTVNSPSRPVLRGHALQIYGTGEGQTSPAGVDGFVIPAVFSALKHPLLPVTVTIGGIPVTPFYAGSAPGEISGKFQVDVTVPDNAPTGDNIPIVLTVGTHSSTGVAYVSIR